jgi:hypothetical protein
VSAPHGSRVLLAARPFEVRARVRAANGVGGVKLVKFGLATNEAVRVYDLSAVTRPWSFVDDVRFNGPNAYLTDAGDPGLIVMNLETGEGRRVLDGHPSTIAQTR